MSWPAVECCQALLQPDMTPPAVHASKLAIRMGGSHPDAPKTRTPSPPPPHTHRFKPHAISDPTTDPFQPQHETPAPTCKGPYLSSAHVPSQVLQQNFPALTFQASHVYASGVLHIQCLQGAQAAMPLPALSNSEQQK